MGPQEKKCALHKYTTLPVYYKLCSLALGVFLSFSLDLGVLIYSIFQTVLA